MSVYFTDAIDVVSDVCRETAGLELTVIGNPRTHGWKGYSFSPLGQMNHHTGPGGWVPLVNFIHHGSSIAPLSQGMTSNPYETGGKVIVALIACGRCNHAGKGVWGPDVPTDAGNRLLWGWEHQHSGSAANPWHPLQREAILRLNVAMNLAFGWKAHNVPDHKDYAPHRKIDRVHENGEAWRDLIQHRMNVGHYSGHTPEVRNVELKRIEGPDWYGTQARMMRTRFRPGDTNVLFVVARGSDEARSVAVMGAPWVEVQGDTVPAASRRVIEHFKPTEVVVLGGPRAVSEAAATECQRIAKNA